MSAEAREAYRQRMREISGERKFRVRFRNLMRQTTEQIDRQMSELQLNVNGNHRTKVERLFRCVLRVLEVPDVPWYPERDEVQGAPMPEEDQWLIASSDMDSEQERASAWPSNRGLPPISALTVPVVTNQPAQQPTLNNLASANNRKDTQQQEASPTDNTMRTPRITINADGETRSRQHLLPPQPDLRRAFASLKTQRDTTNLVTNSTNITRGKEDDQGVEQLRGARPKEAWHRSMRSTATRNIESRNLINGEYEQSDRDVDRCRRSPRKTDNRNWLDDEYIPSDKGFIRVNPQPNLHVTPRRRKKIVPREPSTSSSSGDYSPPPLSSSRLQGDFRDSSPGSSDGESRERSTTNRRRWSRGQEVYQNQPRSRRESRRERSTAPEDNSLHVIKTLKGWGLRYSGEEKESPEQFISRLKACKRATDIPDEQLLPCLASILVREAGDWYEVYQDDMLSWDFKMFEKAFRRQFVGELHEDDIMEELRARYQGAKEKIAPFITKFRRIIAHLKKTPSLREQLNLTFSHLRPEYQDAMWEKKLNSFDAIERYGREFERREAIKERYRSPPRREKTRIAGTNYSGPHRASHKVAAVAESSGTEDTAQPATKTGKKSRAERQEIAAMNNRTTPWPARDQTSRSVPNPAPRRPTATVQNPPGGDKQGLTSAPAPFSISPTSPTGENGLAFVGPCFVCQLVGHRAADCPKRRCYACGQTGHMARTCPARPAPNTIQCQGCGQGGTTLRECPNCRSLVAALGNGTART